MITKRDYQIFLFVHWGSMFVLSLVILGIVSQRLDQFVMMIESDISDQELVRVALFFSKAIKTLTGLFLSLFTIIWTYISILSANEYARRKGGIRANPG